MACFIAYPDVARGSVIGHPLAVPVAIIELFALCPRQRSDETALHFAIGQSEPDQRSGIANREETVVAQSGQG